MKYIILFEDYDITKISKRSPGKFQYLEGIKYKLGIEENTHAVSVDNIKHTVENEFYPEQIERYKEYISEGGVIETFPVEEVKLESTLVKMLEYLDNDIDVAYDILYDTFFVQKTHTLIDKAIGNEFIPTKTSIKQPSYYTEIFDKDEYPEFSRVNKNAYSIDDVIRGINYTNEELELIEVLKKVFDYFDENSEYYLIDFNHRFAAVVELGKKNVLVEVMK